MLNETEWYIDRAELLLPTGPLPLVPGAPCGIVKFNTAVAEVPEFTTAAGVPGAPVVTVPMLTIAGSPADPSDQPLRFEPESSRLPESRQGSLLCLLPLPNRCFLDKTRHRSVH